MTALQRLTLVLATAAGLWLLPPPSGSGCGTRTELERGMRSLTCRPGQAVGA